MEGWIERGGWACAHDQLDAAFEELISGLHAYNRVWMPWRYRRLRSALSLPWLPGGFEDSLRSLQTLARWDHASLWQRLGQLDRLRAALDIQVQVDGLEPHIREIQGRPFAGLGFAGTMAAWQAAHDDWRRDRGVR